MRHPRDFFKPLAVGAPDPLREIPFTPSRMIHFFDPRNEKMLGQAARHRRRRRTSCWATSRTRSRSTTRRPPAPAWSRVGKEIDLGSTPLWTRVNSLESPWVLDDLTTLVTEIGDKLDV